MWLGDILITISRGRAQGPQGDASSQEGVFGAHQQGKFLCCWASQTFLLVASGW